MKAHRPILSIVGFLALAILPQGSRAIASDHADPMSLNPLKSTPEDPDANITDLHAFVVNRNGILISDAEALAENPDGRLVLSMCVHRALQPGQEDTLDFADYTFRIHLDFDSEVEFSDDKEAETKKRGAMPPDDLNNYLRETNSRRAMQQRYGGNILKPAGVTDTAGLAFTLHRVAVPPANTLDSANHAGAFEKIMWKVVLNSKEMNGRWRGDRAMMEIKPWSGQQKENARYREGTAADGAPNPDNSTAVPEVTPFADRVVVQAGVFDDPFIFPRFFRRNVVAVVTSIPLNRLPSQGMRENGSRPVLIWATTHHKFKGQIDHVGRSLRTQLPRFGLLNNLPPADHNKAIQRAHKNPDLVEDLLRSTVSPLFAIRHYDEAPDVMIYNLARPALFPNGRAFRDDVGGILAEGGETLLQELSYAESDQFPRATTNDKSFLPVFPYLAAAWTAEEIKAAAENPAVPYAALSEVIRPPAFTTDSNTKIRAVKLLGMFLLAAVFAGVYYWGRRNGWEGAKIAVGQPGDEGQGITPVDKEYGGSSYREVHAAVIDRTGSRPYQTVWGAPGEKPLPVHVVPFLTLLKGITKWGRPSLLTGAIRRTLHSKSDLRWGPDGRGVRRLVHPNGICMAGKWVIDGQRDADGNFGPTDYTGYFEKGRTGLLLARLSPAKAATERGGKPRSIGFVGKIFPVTGNDAGREERAFPANFFTQEDFGGTRVSHLHECVFTNAPDVHGWRRWLGVPALLLTGVLFKKINVNATIRQLYEIAELRAKNSDPIPETKCPHFMRLKLDISDPDSARKIDGPQLDVREEVMELLYDKGDPNPKRAIRMTIEVSNTDQNTLRRRLTDAFIERGVPEHSWVKIGHIELTEAACSHNGDFVIHFHHPKWRDDPNDKNSEAEVK